MLGILIFRILNNNTYSEYGIICLVNILTYVIVRNIAHSQTSKTQNVAILT